MIKKDTIARIGSDAALRYMAEATKDPKFIEDILKGVLKQELDKGTCFEMKALFDSKGDIMKEIDSELINQAMEYTKDPEQFRIIANNIELHMWLFEKKWMLAFLEKEFPDHYNIILTDSNSDSFKEWIGDQIKIVSDKLLQEFKKIK